MTTSSPGLQVDAELRDLQRLARIARDRDLLGIAARLGSELRRTVSMLGSIWFHM